MLHTDHESQLILVRERREQLRIDALPVRGRRRFRRVTATASAQPACAPTPSAV